VHDFLVPLYPFAACLLLFLFDQYVCVEHKRLILLFTYVRAAHCLILLVQHAYGIFFGFYEHWVEPSLSILVAGGLNCILRQVLHVWMWLVAVVSSDK
jgi:hypothetical protein